MTFVMQQPPSNSDPAVQEYLNRMFISVTSAFEEYDRKILQLEERVKTLESAP